MDALYLYIQNPPKEGSDRLIHLQACELVCYLVKNLSHFKTNSAGQFQQFFWSSMLQNYHRFMELALKTGDMVVQENRYTAVFNIFSYGVRNDHLSMIYFKQRELLYGIIQRKAPLDDFHENMVKNIIICLSSVMLRINQASISLSQPEQGK